LAIGRERAERIVRGTACHRCHEYTFKRLAVKAASEPVRAELHVVWVATRTCGVCGLVEELGLDDDGDVIYVG
jgi:hypothetical protein